MINLVPDIKSRTFLFIMAMGIVCVSTFAPTLATLILFLWLSAFLVVREDSSIILYSLILPLFVLTDFIVTTKFKNFSVLGNPRISYLVFVLVILVIYGLVKKEVVYLDSLFKAACIFLSLVFITVIFSQNVKKSLIVYIFVLFAPTMICVFGASLLSKVPYRRLFEKTTAALLATVLAFSTYQYLTKSFGFLSSLRGQDTMEELGMYSTLKYPSFFASSYATAEFYYLLLPFIIYHFQSRKGRSRIVPFLLAAWTLLGIVWTQSRSGLIITMIILAAIYILNMRDAKLTGVLKKLPIAVAACIIVLVAMYFTELGQEQFSRITSTISGIVNMSPQEIEDKGSTIVRLLRLVIGWNIFLDYPLFGCGMGSVAELYINYGWIFVDAVGGPHNLYVFLLCATGILGFVGFFCFLIAMIMRTIRSYRNSPDADCKRAFSAFLAFELALLLDSLFSGMLGYPSVLFIFMGFAYIHSFSRAREDEAGRALLQGCSDTNLASFEKEHEPETGTIGRPWSSVT